MCTFFPPWGLANLTAFQLQFSLQKSVDVDFISPQMWFGVPDNLYNFAVFDM